jgi:tRNA (guanine-N7-)-methyltransferase
MRIRTHVNPLAYINRFEKLEKYTTFEFKNKLDYEIGFGRGIFLTEYAKQNPTRFIVGAEVRGQAVTFTQEKLKKEKIENALAIQANGLICLKDMFENNSIDNIFIFHPDPWHKKQHLKRRLINQKLLDTAKDKLKRGGKIHISTDVQELWEEILHHFEESKNFKKVQDSFWQNFYMTRWNEIVLQKDRKTFFATFCLK